MKREEFIKKKKDLIDFVRFELNQSKIVQVDKESLVTLLNFLEKYTFDNRLENKGLLSRLIIDNLELDYRIAERIIKFDNDIK